MTYITKTDKQIESLRRRLYDQYRWGIKPAAISLAIFGILVLVAWYLTNDGSTMSTMLMFAGMSVIVLAFLLYFLTPGTYVRGEIADAASISNTLNLGSMLSSLLVETKGIYMPPSPQGRLRVFIPLSNGAGLDAVLPDGETFNTSTSSVKGITLLPPGYELFKYSQSIGAVYSAEGLKSEIKDVMVNGLELASSVIVKQDGDHVQVSMRRLANEGMCATIRRENPGICTQLGCPICSFVGCMVVSGMGRKARIERIGTSNHEINITFELI